jgi:hypothetical protein
MIGRSLNQFARHALGFIATGRVFDHFIKGIIYINWKEKLYSKKMFMKGRINFS